MLGRTVVVSAALILVALAAGTVAADPLHVDQTYDCGTIPPIKGETCVRRTRVTLAVSHGLLGETRITYEREDAMGEVRAMNTPNGWTSERDRVIVGSSEIGDADVSTYGYQSASQPAAGTAGQTERTVSVGSFVVAGATVQVLDGRPQHCIVQAAGATQRVPCHLAHELLP